MNKTKLNFISDEHKMRFEELSLLNKNIGKDRDYTSSAYLLAIHENIFKEAKRVITKDGISHDDLITSREWWDPDREFLINLSACIFRTEETSINITDFFHHGYEILQGFIYCIEYYFDIEQQKISFIYFDNRMKEFLKAQNGKEII